MAIIDKLVAIADAIREKTNTTEKITLTKMPEMISGIKGGGEVEEFINFYDYDGTLLYQYTVANFQKVSDMPALPNNVPGCICKEWNYDLDTIKSMNCHVNVGAIYEQLDDTYTEPENADVIDGTKLYLRVPYSKEFKMYIVSSIANAITIHWGDNNDSIIDSTSYKFYTHTYEEPGEYIITFTITNNAELRFRSLLNNSTSNAINDAIRNMLYKVEIDNRNTALDTNTFTRCFSLKEVYFGYASTVKRSVPSSCFNMCIRLEKVHLTKNMLSVGSSAFERCYSLQEVNAPYNIDNINSSAFAYCFSLKKIELTGKYLQSYAFREARSLEEVILHNFTSVGSQCFYYCTALKSIYLPNTITKLQIETFYSVHSLQHIILPKNATLEHSVFSNCSALQTCIMPVSLTAIYKNTFYYCKSLKHLALPKGVLSIDVDAFRYCVSLKNIIFNYGLQTIKQAFTECYSLMYVILPSTLQAVSDNAFSNIKALRNFSIPDTLSFNSIFLNCTMYNNKYIDMLSTIDANHICNSMYSNNMYIEELPLINVDNIPANAFSYCYNLKQATLSDTVLSIGDSAFRNCLSLESISIPDSVQSIKASAFTECYSLKSLNIPASTEGTSKFLGYNYALETLHILQKVGMCSAEYCYNLKDIIFGASCESVYCYITQCYSIEHLDIQPAMILNTVASYAFAYCYALKYVNLHKADVQSAYNIGNLFYLCYSLRECILADNWPAIASDMFKSCYNLRKVSVGTSITNIGSQAFYDCYNLPEFTCMSMQLKSIEANSFSNCYSLRKVTIPPFVETMAQCFANCFMLSEIICYANTPPTGTTTLGSLAEKYTIYIPKGSLDKYNAQWTAHKGNFKEFVYILAVNPSLNIDLMLSDNTIIIENAFAASVSIEEYIDEISVEYGGNNIVFSDTQIDYDSRVINMPFSRNSDFDYDALEQVHIIITLKDNSYCYDQIIKLKYLPFDDILLPYKDSIKDMTQLTYQADGGWKSISIDPTLCKWKYNGAALTTLYIESNCKFGINGSYSHIQIDYRDNYSRCYYYRYVPFGFMVRWCGWIYSQRNDTGKLEFEIYFINNGDLVIRLVEIGVNCVLSGTYKAFNTSFKLGLDQRYVVLHRLNEAGTDYEVEYTDLYNPRTPIV
jgi:hypothetical protein